MNNRDPAPVCYSQPMLRKSPRTTVVVACLLAAAPTLARAQVSSDSAKADSASRQLKAVKVSATRAAGVVGGAGAVIIRPQELRSSPAPLLHEALRESPFVLVRQNSRGEMEISVRGSDSRQAAVLVDGVPLTLGWDHRTDPSLIPVTGTERMVIVRGVGSLLNGPNTLGGSIEISHDPLGQPAAGRLSAGAGVDQTGAMVGTLGFGKRIVEFANGGLSLSTGVAHRDRNGFVLPKGAVDPTEKDGLRTGSDQRETDGFATLRWNNTRGSSVGFSVSGYNAERGVPPEEHIATGARYWRYPYARRVFGMFSANTGVFKTPLGHGSVDVGVGVNNGNFKISTFTDRTYATTNGEELGDERTTTARVAVMHSVGPATLRASYTNADIKYAETLSPTPAVDYQQKLSSAGVELEIPILSRTQIAGGFVFDDAKTPLTGGRTPLQQPFDNTGWRVGVSHELTSRLHLHGSASERSRFPALRELYSGALNRFRPNPDLKPETLLGIEAGFTVSELVSSVAQSTLQVIGFRNRLDDAVVRITLSNPTRFMRVNRDRIESSGAEILTGFVFGTIAERAVSLNADATIQRIKLFDQTAGDLERRAENNPEQRGRVELGVPLPAAVRVFAVARYTGKQYCLNAGSGNFDDIKSQTVGDLAAQRSFTVAKGGPFRALKALLSLDNVGNSTVYDQCGLPQPGRTARLTMTLR